MPDVSHEIGDCEESAWGIEFRPLTREDFPVLYRWLHTRHVRAWWPREPPATVADLEQKYGSRIDGTAAIKVFIFQTHGEPVGLTQLFRWADRPSREFPVDIPAAATIDFLMGEAQHLGKGVGSAAFAAFVRHVLDFYPDIAVLVGFPHRDNRAFQHVLEKTGYRRLGEAGPALDVRYARNAPYVGPNVLYVLPRPAAAVAAG